MSYHDGNNFPIVTPQNTQFAFNIGGETTSTTGISTPSMQIRISGIKVLTNARPEGSLLKLALVSG
jgi:hypothetical protein